MTDTGDGRDRDVGGPWWWPRPRTMLLDVMLGALSAAECGYEGVGFAGRVGMPVALAVCAGAVIGGLLIARRRRPVAMVLVSVAVTPADLGHVMGIVALYTLAASDVPRRITALLTGMQATGVIITTLIRLHMSVGASAGLGPRAWFVPTFSLVMALSLTAPPVLLGLYVGARRRLVVSLRERADGLERELALLADRAEERAEWARNEERTRIAREMHDVVAHRVSLMVVHAAALQAVALKDPEKASKNAALVGDMGRQALTELRTMLGVLRSDENEGAGPGAAAAAGGGRGGEPGRFARYAVAAAGPVVSAEPGTTRAGAEGGPRAPIPGARHGADAQAGTHQRREQPPEAEESDGKGPRLAELDALVGQSLTAGMPVELSVSGQSRTYPAQVERTAYRVVQEALTNVHKHASGARTRVRLAHREAEVAVQVENERPEGGGAGAGAGLPSGGNGLLGMRERVMALGGGFVSGPTDGGGFRVSAVIPADLAG
jgi:signal transduction histidine kinase